ncbi:MAG: putative repeat containing exported protein periplasmic protein contains a protein [Nitrospira sp.]|nr:putative repeat containing exported protein periplasmic protein contains a protein [Nitrospira sp.]
MNIRWNVATVGTVVCVVCAALLHGCVAQQADLKSAERRFKESSDALAQRGAQQRQELEELKSQELPKLRGELERAHHQAQEIQRAQDDLKQRSAVLEQQTRKLEQLSGKLDAESANRFAQVRESLNAQDLKNKADRDQLRVDVNTRLDDVNHQMEVLRKDIIEAVQKTNTAFAKSLDVKLEEQRKALADNQARTEQLSAKFAQFNQALTGFRESLTSLGDRIAQEEQASKGLAAKVEADTKASTAHINETTRSMSGHLGEVNKSVNAVAQKLAVRIDEQLGEVNKNVSKLDGRMAEQDRRIDGLTKSLDHVAQEVHARPGGSSKAGQRQQPAAATKSTQRSSAVGPAEGLSHHEAEPVAAARQDPETVNHIPERTVASDEPAESVAVASAVRSIERSDKAEYERVLAFFKEGNLEGSREGFSAFLTEYPNSELAPNARYWLGESHYGKRDFKQAIDSYDRVELDYPQSEKVPAAILKKGFAYLALKDKKRASSAFKQVVTLYPKSPEAGKAYDKLNQLKELR